MQLLKEILNLPANSYGGCLSLIILLGIIVGIGTIISDRKFIENTYGDYITIPQETLQELKKQKRKHIGDHESREHIFPIDYGYTSIVNTGKFYYFVGSSKRIHKSHNEEIKKMFDSAQRDQRKPRYK